MKDLAALLDAVAQQCRTVGDFILEQRPKMSEEHIEEKSLNSLVSYVDKQAEQRLVDGLKVLLPEAGFLAEEGTQSKRGDKYNWIIDPLDGTTNFLHGLPLFAISIALEKEGELVLGVIYELGQKELFTAYKGGGAFLNGHPIQAKNNSEISKGLFATGFPYHDFGRLEAFNHLLNYFFKHSRGLRRLGSAATDLAYVACGRFDGFFEYGLSAWDIAAGVVLVREAGGAVSDYEGGEDFLKSGDIIAAGNALFPEFQKVILEKMA